MKRRRTRSIGVERTHAHGAHAKPVPDPSSEDFAFLVAQYAWRDGLTANAIVRKLGYDATPLHLMQVKRALRRAHDRYLKLIPPQSVELADELRERLPRPYANRTRFHVVNDDGPAYAAVASRAAELVVEIITDLVAKLGPLSKPEEKIVVCNSGGSTLSAVVRALRQHPPAGDGDDSRALGSRLTFVGGNAVYLPKQFQRSANFLSVTMAELFGAEHFACPRPDDLQWREEYRELVDRISLAICAVGTPSTGLMANHLVANAVPLPAPAVGDLAFNLLDSSGRGVELSDSARALTSQLNSALDLSMLRDVAEKGRVLLVLESDPPEAKAEVSAAALKRGCYATDVVLGKNHAKHVLAALNGSPARKPARIPRG